MGLDTSHECWHGAYSAFHRWRCEIAKLKGMPPLQLMEGFYRTEGMGNDPFYNCDNFTASEIKKNLPIRWDSLKPDPIHELLYHSDCDGSIAWWRCKEIAESLETVIEKMEGDAGGHIGNWKEKTQAFVDGLLVAYFNYEDVNFH